MSMRRLYSITFKLFTKQIRFANFLPAFRPFFIGLLPTSGEAAWHRPKSTNAIIKRQDTRKDNKTIHNHHVCSKPIMRWITNKMRPRRENIFRSPTNSSRIKFPFLTQIKLQLEELPNFEETKRCFYNCRNIFLASCETEKIAEIRLI